MNLHDAITAYLENTSDKAARLLVSRRTLYNWKARPESADLRAILEDLHEIADAIGRHITEPKPTAHGRIMDEQQSDD